MIILRVTIDQGFTLTLENTFKVHETRRQIYKNIDLSTGRLFILTFEMF